MDRQKDTDRFTTAIGVLVDVFRLLEPLSQAAILTYWDALKGYSIEAVEQACRTAAVRSMRFPPPAALADLADDFQPSEPYWTGLPPMPVVTDEELAERKADIAALRKVAQAANIKRKEQAQPSLGFRNLIDGLP